MSEYEILLQFAPYLITLVMGLIGGWAIVKKRISAIRKLVDSVDDAVQDDNVTEPEFKQIWNNARNLISS